MIGERREVVDPSAEPESEQGTGPRREGAELLLQRHWEPPRIVEIPQAGAGPHGGGDALLLDDLFRGAAEDPLGRRAGFRDGVASVLVGVAANQAIATARPAVIADLGVPLRPRHAGGR